MVDKARSWQTWLNPKPMSRAWWLEWFVGLLFLGALMLGAVLYVYITASAGEVPNQNFGLRPEDAQRIENMLEEGSESSSEEEELARYGLRPEDARRLERMLEKGEYTSSEEEELSRSTLEKSFTTRVSVPVISISLWPLLVILLVTGIGAIYILARHLLRPGRSDAKR